MNALHQAAVLQTDSYGADDIETLGDDFGEQSRFKEARLLSQPSLGLISAERDTEPRPASGGDTFQLYLREIGRAKLLQPEEENLLAERVKQGDDQAREQMISANLRLVVKIARGYEGLGLPLLDLISEGNIGLIKGVERFRPNMGARLSTYAAWWIKEAMRRALGKQSKIIRLPVNVTHKVADIHRTEAKLRDSLAREATDQEIADDMEVSPRCLKRYRQASQVVVSLDSAVSNEDSTPISECIPDENAARPFDELLKGNDNDQLHEVLAMLDPRQSRILIMRFGLDDGRPKTLEEVADHFGITRERIGQIQEQALEKARFLIEKQSNRSSVLVF